VDAKRHMLVEREVARQLSFHERKRAVDRRPRTFDVLD
jgi:hypothetical protein